MAVLVRKTWLILFEPARKFLWPERLCLVPQTQLKQSAGCNKLPLTQWRKKFEVYLVKFARTLGLAAISLAMAATFAPPASGQLLHKKKTTIDPPPKSNLAPDKVLYDRAQDAIKHGRYEVARLQLQALLNTYPDSEYLAQAKLAIGDSYFKEGGAGNLNLATDEYKSFITFFPFLPEAAYAQMQIAMVHYRRMDRSDRDHTEAQLAEQEFQTFLQKYPDSPLVAQSTQRLREIQEALADSDFRIASFYYTRKSYRASASRLGELVERYPLYSNTDQALLMLGSIWERAPVASKEDEALSAARRELAVRIYQKIVTDYPLSPEVPRAKERLKALGAPIPQPDAAALARMQQERTTPRDHNGVVTKGHRNRPQWSESFRSRAIRRSQYESAGRKRRRSFEEERLRNEVDGHGHGDGWSEHVRRQWHTTNYFAGRQHRDCSEYNAASGGRFVEHFWHSAGDEWRADNCRHDSFIFIEHRFIE